MGAVEVLFSGGTAIPETGEVGWGEASEQEIVIGVVTHHTQMSVKALNPFSKLFAVPMAYCDNNFYLTNCI